MRNRVKCLADVQNSEDELFVMVVGIVNELVECEDVGMSAHVLSESCLCWGEVVILFKICGESFGNDLGEELVCGLAQ